MIRNVLPLALVAVASAALPAQNGPLVGFASDFGANSAILREALCNPPFDVCSNALPSPAERWSGGAALDPSRNAIWHTQGTRLFGVGLAACDPLCAIPVSFALGAGSRAGGLTWDARSTRLYHVESTPGIGAIVGYDAPPSARCPSAVSRCQFLLPSTLHRAGAIALDESRDTFFVATSRFVAGADPQNRLLVIRQGDPQCGTVCFVGVPSCGRTPLGAITAMTYDACDDRLYISDGRRVGVYRVQQTSTGCPSLVAETCCLVNDGQGRVWHGIDRQTIEPRQLGGGCLERRACPACAVPPRLDPIGLPQVGNPTFGFELTNSPTGSTAFLLINFGGCQPLPLGCGQLFPALPAIALGPVPVAGVGACDGSAQFPLPIPENFAFCNLLMCVQGVMICPAGGLGLSNAQVVPIGS